MKLAEVLKEYMWAKKLTTRTLAQELGWSPATVSRFVNGKPIDGTHLAALLRWLLAITLLALPPMATTAFMSGAPLSTAINRAETRLMEYPATSYYVLWARANDVEYRVDSRFVDRQTRADPLSNTIWLYPGFSGTVYDASLLVHEIKHLIDGPSPECLAHPWSEETAYFAQLSALYMLDAQPRDIQAVYRWWEFCAGQPHRGLPCGVQEVVR